MGGLFGWGVGRQAEAPAPVRPTESTATSVILPRFLGALAQRSSPTLLDLGPAIGANVTFLGERLGCRLLIGDLHKELAARRDAPPEDLRSAILDRLGTAVSMPLDAVLCWDAFDYFDRRTAHAVAEFLVRRLMPGGIVHGMFGTTPAELDCYTRYVLQSATTLTCRYEPVRPVKRTVLSTSDLAAMFAGTKVTESVLLKNQRREILLRKG